MNKQTNVIPRSHHIRTAFAALFGAVAIWLILSSILVVWLNQTLTNTGTFTSTVAPLVTKPAVQNFVIEKVTDALMNGTPTQDIANSLLPASQITGKTIQQLQTQVQALIQNSVTQIVQSQQFAVLWQTTTTSAHKQLISEINSNATNLTLDLSPAITGIVQQLKQTDLAPISANIATSPDAGKLNLKGSGIAQAHHYYKLFQESTIGIIIAAVIMVALAVMTSVHHIKTIRRILIFIGVESLLLAAVLEVPRFINPGSGSGHVEEAAALAFAQVLLHNLQVASFIIGVVCITAAFLTKIYSNIQAKSVKKAQPFKPPFAKPKVA